MKEQTKSTVSTLALELFLSRVKARGAEDYWRNEAERAPGLDPEERCAHLIAKYVSHVIARSVELAEGKQEAKGIAIPAGLSRDDRHKALTSQAGKRRSQTARRAPKAKLSQTDREEILGTVSLVLATRGAFSRPLEREDWLDCFRLVESADCLGMNRRNVRLENAEEEELTISRLAAPTYFADVDAAREELLAEKLDMIFQWIDAAAAHDSSRKAAANAEKWKAYAQAVATRQAESLHTDKRERRRAKAEFMAYLEAGKTAMNAFRFAKAPWLPAPLALANF